MVVFVGALIPTTKLWMKWQVAVSSRVDRIVRPPSTRGREVTSSVFLGSGYESSGVVDGVLWETPADGGANNAADFFASEAPALCTTFAL